MYAMKLSLAVTDKILGASSVCDCSQQYLPQFTLARLTLGPHCIRSPTNASGFKVREYSRAVREPLLVPPTAD